MIVIFCCLGLACTNINKKRYLLSTENTSTWTVITIGEGILLLVYPLLGHLADVYLTRYRALKSSLIILTIISFAGFVYEGIDAAASLVGKYLVFHHSQTSIIVATSFITYIIGLGLFEANIIQFGLDQLLEAPTPKLIAFIHWYYWSQSVGGLALFYVYEGKLVEYHSYRSENSTQFKILDGSMNNLAAILLILINTTILIILCISKKRFYIEKAGLNPFKNIYKVLKYS